MQPRTLTIDYYFKNFNFQEQGTGTGIEQESEIGENYFFAQVYMPKTFFKLDDLPILSTRLINHQLDNLPDKILTKFELFGMGFLGDHEAFIFKPWILDISDQMLCDLLESFHLFVPSTLFYNLIERLIFTEQLNKDAFKHIRILQDLPTNTFQRFGLDKGNVNKTFETTNLKILRIENPDTYEISEFYRKNWESITPELQHKYFRPLLTIWFRIKLKYPDKTIGFIRLYNTNSVFTGGTSIEYVVDTSYRNKGYATESVFAVIEILRFYSYAISLGAEVNVDNQYSVKLLKNLGFIERNSYTPYNRDNFYLSLTDILKEIEMDIDNNALQITMQNRYANKYERYF